MSVLTVVSFVLVSLGMVYAWWDIQKAKLHNDEHAQSMLRGEVNSLKVMDQELRRSMSLLEQNLIAGIKDNERLLVSAEQKTAMIVASQSKRIEGLREELDSLQKSATALATEHFNQESDISWCKQNIRDLGKAPPVAQTRPRPMPFGQKRG